jgi:hypothetical protein
MATNLLETLKFPMFSNVNMLLLPACLHIFKRLDILICALTIYSDGNFVYNTSYTSYSFYFCCVYDTLVSV